MPFASLGLLPELTRALADRNYTQPTPVQARVIPEILAGRDILAGSQTGTGKTAGFTLPLLQRLHAAQNPSRSPRAVVLVPTRELAAQVADSIKSYGKYLNLRTLTIFGGVSINPQIDALRRGADILVATPGRLLDHAGQGNVDLKQVQVLVLDEADRMLDMGFIADIRRVIKLLPSQRQNLLFSATYSDDIRRLAQGLLKQPVEIEVARRNAAVDTVEQNVYLVQKDRKRALLSHLIREGDWSQVLVFTRTKHGANRLTKQLQDDGIEAAAIHGNKSQSARTKALADFKGFNIRALVATEVAARGLDIKELPHVVNYELPNVPEDYVHRIGRTGRAGATGAALSLVSADESGLLKDIERVLGKRVPQLQLPQISEPPVGRSVAPRESQEYAPHQDPRRQSRPQQPQRPNDGGHRSGRRGQGRPQGNSQGGGQRDGRPSGNSQQRDFRGNGNQRSGQQGQGQQQGRNGNRRDGGNWQARNQGRSGNR
ncbi:ATP-dependent RNA helicase RhlE [Povalibacter uvarum]|uniref:DEAD-box ATP-dependent RNA helicase RhpA n=1 Tax=Povalibacter uvarum TaxID=732238 RepID=A0A841HLG3_9GAMM|nr:DEAD/DEAH box helicase [Povalibacter uvarum]MBB6092952.1 ATP-dependent RNA helicase RhlE [Povalibacter uvarum]